MQSRVRLFFAQWLIWGSLCLVFVMPHVHAVSKSTVKSDIPRGRITLLAEGRGHPWITMADGRELDIDFERDLQLRTQLAPAGLRGLSLAAGDFDQDGVTDLVSGYATSVGGLVRIHRGNPAYFNSRLPIRLPGEAVPAPFLPSLRQLELSIAPDFLAVGDFDGDDAPDLLVASRDQDFLLCYLGTGNGELEFDREIRVDGRVTELVAADINRKDGLEEIVIGVEGPTGSFVRIYASHRGALGARPVDLQLDNPVEDIAAGRLDSDHTVDLAVGEGNQVLIVKGWDGRPDWLASGVVPAEEVISYPFPDRVSQLVAGDISGDTRQDVALLLQTGEIRILEGSEDGLREALSFSIHDSTSRLPAGEAAGDLASRLTTGRAGTLPKDTLILTDPERGQIRVVLPGRAWFESEVETRAELASDPAFVDFDYLGTPIAVLPLFLNRDALSDFVVLGADPGGISVTESECSGGFVVNMTSEENDADLTDNVCDINLETPQIHECTFKAAMSQANRSPGHDCISFSVPSVPGLHRYPYVEDSVTVNGLMVTPDGPQKVVIQGDPSANTFGLVTRTGNCMFDSLKVSGFGKGAISLTREGDNKIQDCDIGEGNLGWGIWVTGVSNSIERTKVVGNTGYGVLVSGSEVGNNLILGCDIIDNTNSGIHVGSLATAEIINNKVLRNGLHGIWLGTIEDTTSETEPRGSLVKGNTIESNKWTGIVVQGEAVSILENTIAYNGTEGERGSGIELWGTTGNEKNKISGNFIFGNVGLPHTSQEYGSKGLGIDIYGDGVTPNDGQKDADSGVNGEQNFPVLIMRDDNRTVEVKLHSTPNHEFEIEFYGNQECDPSGYGEGMTPLGKKTFRTDTHGNLICEFVDSCTYEAPGHDITATATDQNNNTSEFSKCASAVAPGGAGKVTILGSTVPLPHIKVIARDSEDHEVASSTTDSAGEYVLKLDPGEYLIDAVPMKGIPERSPEIREALEQWFDYEDESVPMPYIEMGVQNRYLALKEDAESLKKFGDVGLPEWLPKGDAPINRRHYADEMDDLMAFAGIQGGIVTTDERVYRLYLATDAAESISDSVTQHSEMIVKLVTDIVATRLKFSVLNRIIGNALALRVAKFQNWVIGKTRVKSETVIKFFKRAGKYFNTTFERLERWSLNLLASRGLTRNQSYAIGKFVGFVTERSSLTPLGKLNENTLKAGLRELGTGIVLDAYAQETEGFLKSYIERGKNFVPTDDKLEANHTLVRGIKSASRGDADARLSAIDQSWAGYALDLVSALKDAAEVFKNSVEQILVVEAPLYRINPYFTAFIGTLKSLQLTLRGGSVIYLAPALAKTLPTELIAATSVAFGDTYSSSSAGVTSALRHRPGTLHQVHSNNTVNPQLANASERYTNHLNEARRMIEDEAFDDLITHITENLISADEELGSILLLSVAPIEDLAVQLLEDSQTEQQYTTLIDTGFASSLSRLVAMVELYKFLLEASALSDEAYLARRQELFDRFDEAIQFNTQMMGQVSDLEAIVATIDSDRAVAAIHDVSASSNGEPVDLITTTPFEVTIRATVSNLSDSPISDLTASILSLDPDLDTTINGPQSHTIVNLGPYETQEVTWGLTFAGSLQLTSLPLTLVLEADPSEVYTGSPLNYQIDIFDEEDSDSDGLSDAYEEGNGLDPLVFSTGDDPDGDGLSNFMEFVLGTDPQKRDTDGDGVSDLDEYDAGTDPLDPAQFPTQEKHLYFPFYQGGGGSFSGFAVSNYSQGDVNLEFKAYDANGTLLTSGSNPSDYTLSSENQLARLGHEIFQVSASTDHKGWVELKADSSQIGSFFLFGSGTQMDGSVAIEEKSKKLYFTRIVDGEYSFWGETADTYLAVANPNDQSATVELTLVASDDLVGTEGDAFTDAISPLVTTKTIPGKGYLYEDVSDLFGTDIPIMSGYVAVEVIEGEGVAGFELIVLPEADTAIGLNAAYGDDSQILYSAQLANGPDIFTDLNLINTDDQDRVVTAIGIAQDGSELGREQFTLQPGEYMNEDTAFLFDTNLDETTVGSIQVEADGTGVIGDVIFGEFELLRYAAALPLQSKTFTKAVFSHVAVTSDLFTGLALYNPGVATAQATIGVFTPDGQKKGERILELQPGARTSKLIRELVAGLTEQAGGYIVIESTQPLVAQQLFGMLTSDLLSSVPPTIVQ